MALASLVLLTVSENSEDRANQTDTPLKPDYHRVIRVIDGDTITVSINDKVETVRLIGIDSPELPDECFAGQARAKVRQILTGQTVKLESDQSQNNRDRYDRLLRYVILEDGTNLNGNMIAEGYAREFTFVEPYKLQPEFKKAQATAKQNNLGLWKPGFC